MPTFFNRSPVWNGYISNMLSPIASTLLWLRDNPFIRPTRCSICNGIQSKCLWIHWGKPCICKQLLQIENNKQQLTTNLSVHCNLEKIDDDVPRNLLVISKSEDLSLSLCNSIDDDSLIPDSLPINDYKLDVAIDVLSMKKLVKSETDLKNEYETNNFKKHSSENNIKLLINSELNVCNQRTNDSEDNLQQRKSLSGKSKIPRLKLKNNKSNQKQLLNTLLETEQKASDLHINKITIEVLNNDSVSPKSTSHLPTLQKFGKHMLDFKIQLNTSQIKNKTDNLCKFNN